MRETTRLSALSVVLILILMEHAQREKQFVAYCERHGLVLILILMEHAQRALENHVDKSIIDSLNPYFNGTCSKR